MRGYRLLISALALSGLALLTAIVGPARADPANVHLIGIAPEAGFFRWTYSLTLTPTESLVAGDYFTIYDFDGFVPGSMLAPDPSWINSSALAGPTPPSVIPLDNLATPNLTFTWGGGGLTGVTIPGFSALSRYDGVGAGQYTSLTTDAVTLDQGKIQTLGEVSVPRIPEPGTLALLGVAGLAAAAMGAVVRTRRARRTGVA